MTRKPTKKLLPTWHIIFKLQKAKEKENILKDSKEDNKSILPMEEKGNKGINFFLSEYIVFPYDPAITLPRFLPK